MNCRSVKSHSVNSLSVNSRSVRWDSVMCRRTDGHLAKDRRLLRRDSEQNPGAFMALWARLMGAIFPSRPLWRTRFRM